MTKGEAILILDILKKYQINIEEFNDTFIKRGCAYTSARKYILQGMTEMEFNLIKTWLKEQSK